MMLRFALVTALAAAGLIATAPTASAHAPAPAPPVDVVAEPGVSSIRVSWRSPAVDTGLSHYVAYAEPGGASCATLDWRTFGCVLGARAGVSYRISVRSNGTSAPAYAPGRSTPGSPSAPASVPADAFDLQTRRAGARVEVRGAGFLPRSSVALAGYRADGTGPATLAMPAADTDGGLTAVVVPPDGVVTLLARGAGPDGEPRTLVATAVRGGGLPVTGLRVTGPAALGFAMIVLGAFLLVLTRIRRP
ncbi:hypothetical protein [Catenuloplanes atrovinosus]|uniref:Fibronectin type-III domain-containing protein n=1 Tax=Catenuloplanes atrovinosus TaxID=137266 RepID=A0AAE4CBD5_9ACTN|nr:hypothetical protein [Catenuloplanes atrovinosus]MDR7276779.1 hypothetical protein [Catenuloplanes atrovinosus]